MGACCASDGTLTWSISGLLIAYQCFSDTVQCKTAQLGLVCSRGCSDISFVSIVFKALEPYLSIGENLSKKAFENLVHACFLEPQDFCIMVTEDRPVLLPKRSLSWRQEACQFSQHLSQFSTPSFFHQPFSMIRIEGDLCYSKLCFSSLVEKHPDFITICEPN